ncbi:MAG: hypothetical protein GEEBNDBF_01353 [bacterium]|nr:hypothetical protein [bacterium]
MKVKGSHRDSLSLRHAERGFTLLEILLVVAIIAILLAMAIPQVTGSKKSAWEVGAMQAVKSLGAAQHAYQSSYRQFTSFYHLQRLNYVDRGYSHGGGTDATRMAKHYSVWIELEPPIAGRTYGFSVFAVPDPGFGLKTFRLTENGVMQESTGGGYRVK